MLLYIMLEKKEEKLKFEFRSWHRSKQIHEAHKVSVMTKWRMKILGFFFPFYLVLFVVKSQHPMHAHPFDLPLVQSPISP